jgi:hypothetical protein
MSFSLPGVSLRQMSLKKVFQWNVSTTALRLQQQLLIVM